MGVIAGVNAATGIISNCYIHSSIDFGIYAETAYAGCIVGENNGIIEYCKVQATAFSNIAGKAYVGGIVGNNTDGVIENCYYAIAATTGAVIKGKSKVGGLVGNMVSGSISNCYMYAPTNAVSASEATCGYDFGEVLPAATVSQVYTFNDTIVSSETVSVSSWSELPDKTTDWNWDTVWSNSTTPFILKNRHDVMSRTCSVKFVDWQNEVISQQTVEYGEAAGAPTPPVREHYRFTGWNKSFASVISDITVTAQYAIDTFTVKLIDDDNTVLATRTVAYGSAATAPTVTHRYGYTQTWDKSFSNITGDLTVTAVYTHTHWVITFFNYNGTVYARRDVEFGTTLPSGSMPSNPTRTGYTFNGWDRSFTSVSGDLTVKALFKINSHSVTFADDDGTILATVTVAHGSAAQAPTVAHRNGYTQTWNKDFSNIIAGITVTAVYTHTHLVVFVDYDNTVIAYHEVVFDGYLSDIPADPIRTGYKFIGWDTDTSAQITQDITIKALYERMVLTVTFDKNNGEGTFAVTVNYGNTVAVPTQTPTDPDGAQFLGWYYCGKPFSFTKTITQSITLFAAYDKLIEINTMTDLLKAGINLVGRYKLMCDIVAPSFTPIGRYSSSASPFTGTFEGNNHTITYSCSSTSQNYVGLFACNAGQIQNLIVCIDGTVSGSVCGTLSSGECVGGFVAYNQTGSICNCYARVYAMAGYNRTGGFVGVSDGGTISNCYNYFVTMRGVANYSGYDAAPESVFTGSNNYTVAKATTYLRKFLYASSDTELINLVSENSAWVSAECWGFSGEYVKFKQQQPTTTHMVTIVDGITNPTIQTLLVPEGNDVTLPTPPTHDGGWSHDGKNITADTVIIAQCAKKLLLGNANGDGEVGMIDALLLRYNAGWDIGYFDSPTTSGRHVAYIDIRGAKPMVSVETQSSNNVFDYFFPLQNQIKGFPAYATLVLQKYSINVVASR